MNSYSNFSIKYQKRINKLCQPMMDYLGINWVSYGKIKADGTMINLVNRPEVIESYFEHKAYLCDPLLRDPKELPSGITLLNELPSTEYAKIQEKCSEIFNIDLGLAIINSSSQEATILAIEKKRGRVFPRP